ncbi:hypothetical protein [Streptomonospora salina]|uniref:DUF2637 domain-containing protein n=1 Tax=Streptomonospora salina TaxID=104205 RepID=A0A841ELY2_9ACTN|nr:hypothetical protein [Streptomonospora salina]MBB6001320.1 hypothetical protein [Streptomonospora salina]
MTNVQPTKNPFKQAFWRHLPVQRSASSPGAVRVIILAAAIPSLASLILTVWSLMDSLPDPAPWGVGLAAGGVLDVALVSAVVIAWSNPAVARPAEIAGWAIAALAGVLVGWHSYGIDPMLVVLGLVPLVSKALWGLALRSRISRHAQEAEEAEAKRLAEAEEARREAELSTDLTHAQRAEVARRRQEAAYARELAAADRDYADATAEAEHEQKLASTRRAAEQRMALDREEARVAMQRQDLIREVRAGQGLALGSGEVPDDASSLSASPEALMGFGGAMGAQARTAEGLEPRLRELLDYVAQAGEDASVRAAARALGCDAATVRRRRDVLAEQGYDVSPLTRTTK